MDVKWVPLKELEKMTENELRSYDSNINIINSAKNNKQYPLNLIKNFK